MNAVATMLVETALSYFSMHSKHVHLRILYSVAPNARNIWRHCRNLLSVPRPEERRVCRILTRNGLWILFDVLQRQANAFE